MSSRHLVAWMICLLVCSLLYPNNSRLSAEQQFSPDLRYVFVVDRVNATSHLGHVTVEFRTWGRFSVALRFWPVIVLDNGLEVRNLRAMDEGGRFLETTYSLVERRMTWTVRTQGAQEVRVDYDVMMDFFFGRGATLDREYVGYLCATFGVAMASWIFLVPELPVDRVSVQFVLPEGWGPVTPWQVAGTQYLVSSLDFLVSSVFAVGKFDCYSRNIAGTNVTIAAFSDWSQSLKWSLAEYSFRAYEALITLFGTAIQDRYLSIYTPSADDGGTIGGLEWTQAQANTIDPQGFAVYQALQGILHRAFHNWAGFPPHEMGRKSQEEQWFSEGVNRYYDDDKIPIQLGILRRHENLRRRYDDYLRLIAGTKYDVPVAFASQFDNGQDTDYYLRLAYHKGSLIGFLLDELIRSLTQDKASLDPVLARLYERFGTPHSTRSYLAPVSTQRYSNEDIFSEISKLTGKDLCKFFNLHIYGNSRLPLKPSGANDLEVDWSALSLQLGMNLSATTPMRPQPLTVGRFRIDGKASDWSTYESAASDPKGDSKKVTLSADLKAVYAVADSEYLYVMIQLWDRPDPDNDYVFPVDIDGDGQWDFSFGFNLDRVWMYDLHGMPRGQWPRERLSYLYVPHDVDEVAEIAIPMFILGRPNAATMWLWINNRGTTVDEASSAPVKFLSEGKPPASLTTAITAMVTATTMSSTRTTSVTSPVSPNGFPTDAPVLLTLFVIAIMAVLLLWKVRVRKLSHNT